MADGRVASRAGFVVFLVLFDGAVRIVKSIFSRGANQPMLFMMPCLITGLLYGQKQRLAAEAH